MDSRAQFAPSYTPSYFSIEDILATSERLPCKFERTVVGLGFLDTSGRSKDLDQGSKLELPFWMASALGPRRKIVSCQLPRAFNKRYREILQADASLVDLHSLSPHYYEFGRHLLLVIGAETGPLGQLLTETLKNRLRGVMDSSLNCLEDEAASHKTHLDQLERELFHTGRKTFHDQQLWLSRRSHIITTTPAIQHLRKRKLLEIS